MKDKVLLFAKFIVQCILTMLLVLGKERISPFHLSYLVRGNPNT